MGGLQRTAQELLDYYVALPRWARVTAALVWMGTLWWLTARPTERLSGPPIHPVFWNCLHVFAFGFLGALLFMTGDGKSRRQCIWAAAITATYGIATELNQALIGTGRRGDPWDAVSNATGGVIFACILLWLRAGSRRALWVMAATLPVALVAVVGASGLL